MLHNFWVSVVDYLKSAAQVRSTNVALCLVPPICYFGVLLRIFCCYVLLFGSFNFSGLAVRRAYMKKRSKNGLPHKFSPLPHKYSLFTP